MSTNTRTALIVGNWKMNHTVSETIRVITEFKSLLSGKQDAEIVIAPPFTSLHPAEIAANGTPLLLAGQNMWADEKGAFTGEISPNMLVDIGCTYVILGHSERRKIIQENDQLIGKKVQVALENELKPILCIGESKEERKNEKTFAVIETQLKSGLRHVSEADAELVTIAYEPVWAIGTGDTATPAVAQEVHQFIREKLGLIFHKDVAAKMRIIYGGSVTPGNVKGLMAQGDIDGALVGGASLKATSFAEIIQFGE